MINTILGLGNPGKQYQRNRHNFGQMLIERIVERLNLTLKPGRNRSAFTYAETNVADRTVYFCKNTTYMNESGLSAWQILMKLNHEAADLLVVYDDIDLPLGRIRLREKGSAGGHRGLRSVIEALATSEFPRLRLGIGPQDEGVPSEDFVLTDFRPMEKKLVMAVLDASYDCVMTIIEKGIRPAMEQFNRRDPGEIDIMTATQKPIILT
ncbi:MAG: aminoacyl-tRNA hydrolase [Candidatus Marinimicrobia bacterium]|jgi:PTH1 family peptidyl-tRNA hydrolase|nr:aminoacyl-tRNA hydrolase [Candidatus Neomarinimicrobiota bacterium]MCK9483061.1 aminoacyl-tRNA hydrolase [Candidatus Neomarinimicrobiota bacterium]MCK9559584.1 aminoacyl-tRNA hydrolase [Candidatus Neomarinimicrobiota bacterium]MDD5061054.1 aminoacyl-tRNA hydrolase [Candidatus Neomarinimicrobiota bacterium]MDD5230041.1 aminoacyl-tRNA hydrolase [Candidatus Neomarinimicrobiota bacterium]